MCRRACLLVGVRYHVPLQKLFVFLLTPPPPTPPCCYRNPSYVPLLCAASRARWSTQQLGIVATKYENTRVNYKVRRHGVDPIHRSRAFGIPVRPEVRQAHYPLMGERTRLAVRRRCGRFIISRARRTFVSDCHSEHTRALAACFVVPLFFHARVALFGP